MNLPNLLTLARIFLVPVFLFAFLTRVPVGGQIAAAVFIVAAITDGVDGYLARKNKQVTRLGKFLDPLADKLLVSAALIALVELKEISTWVALVIIGREMAVTGLRSIAAAEGTIIAAGPWGKAKTVVQIIFIVDAILLRALPATWWALPTLADWLFQPLLWAAVALTIWSGIDYFVAYVRGLRAGRSTPKPPKPLRFRFKLPRRKKLT
ncbi:MAG TPA: CDP-diacylglycerol--glycerol-3-phosphate 3-phosphatidyltransferase [Symbiobacteriaceae bacterium]|nr:CDP-diacylglycerol--glycerol-3-phosphate 3-phosphatidyltransferase [Symbiobacteriaceae bacterium]